jgi:hypothetical protein
MRVPAQSKTVLVLSRHKVGQVAVVDKVAAGTLDLDHILAEWNKSRPEDML